MSGGARVSEQIVETVADSTGRDALELPPLYDAVDPDALDRLLERTTNGEVSFSYAGHRVTVADDRTVRLEALDGTPDDASGETAGVD